MRFTLQKAIVPRGGMNELKAELVEAGLPVWGLFAAQIGARSDEVELIVAGEESPALESASVEHVHLIESTVRPTTTDRVTDDGVFALRWFEIVEWNWPEFLKLSETAWPAFEAANPGVRIHGFFRMPENPSRVLLVTRYPSLAAWEASRNAPDDAGGANFRRRHELTLSTIVRTYRAII
jgi:hypothetical protein